MPAGEFDALRIQREVFAGNSNAFTTQEEITETDWYVPALRRPVTHPKLVSTFRQFRAAAATAAGNTRCASAATG